MPRLDQLQLNSEPHIFPEPIEIKKYRKDKNDLTFFCGNLAPKTHVCFRMRINQRKGSIKFNKPTWPFQSAEIFEKMELNSKRGLNMRTAGNGGYEFWYYPNDSLDCTEPKLHRLMLTSKVEAEVKHYVEFLYWQEEDSDEKTHDSSALLVCCKKRHFRDVNKARINVPAGVSIKVATEFEIPNRDQYRPTAWETYPAKQHDEQKILDLVDYKGVKILWAALAPSSSPHHAPSFKDHQLGCGGTEQLAIIIHPWPNEIG